MIGQEASDSSECCSVWCLCCWHFACTMHPDSIICSVPYLSYTAAVLPPCCVCLCNRACCTQTGVCSSAACTLLACLQIQGSATTVRDSP